MSMSDVLKEAGNIEKKLKQLDVDLKNKEAYKINLESDIKSLVSKKNELVSITNDLKKTLAIAVSKATESEMVKIKNLEEQKADEVSIVRNEKGTLVVEKERYKSLSKTLESAIDKNKSAAYDLAQKNNDADAVKSMLNKVKEMIKDTLNG